MSKSISTDQRIGILGGGQLGRMLLQESVDFGLELNFMDAANSPCANICSNFTVGDIRNKEEVLNFGKNLDVLTIEIENVNVEALYELESQGVLVYPQARVLELIQDKGLQKQFYQKIGINTAPYELIDSKEELGDHLDFYPVMQKLRKGGYDGKGVQKIGGEADFSKAFDAPSVLEQFVDLEKELAVIVARNADGQITAFPVVEQEFNPEANLVEFLFSPANVSESLALEATALAEKIISELDMIGILAIEFFLDKSGELFVNEIAPRPHNSGHQTIEGNITSQFEQHLRSILNYPLGSTATIWPSVMINLLGEPGSTGKATYYGLEAALKIEGVYPHIYGKHESKPFRKMGHVTVINQDLEKAKGIAKEVKTLLTVSGQ